MGITDIVGMKTTIYKKVTIGVFLTAGLLLSGCSSSGGSTASDESFTSGSVGDYTEVPSVSQVETSDMVREETGSMEVVEKDRAVVTTGSLQLIADEPVTVSSDIQNIVSNAGGRVDSITENPATDYSTAAASLRIRVPSENLETVIAEVKDIGIVEEYTSSSTDVTDTLKDYEVRIASLRTSIDRLLELMTGATDTTALLAIETTLSQRQSELESLLASQANLQDSVDYSTVEVYIQAPEDAAAPEPGSFIDGFIGGWEALIATVSGLLIVTGFLIPWVVVLGVIGLVTLLIVRKRRKNKNVVPPVAAPTTPEETVVVSESEEAPKE